MRAIFTLLSITCASFSFAQILSISPANPTVNDNVTIIYDATQGNGALEGTATVYAHAGLITENSTAPSDWKYVQGTWGADDAKVKMENIGDNKHRISFNIKTFYGVPETEAIEQLSFVFRNADGSTVGRSADGSDIYYELLAESSPIVIETPSNTRNVIKQNTNAYSVTGRAYKAGNISVYIDDSLHSSESGVDAFNEVLDLSYLERGSHWLWVSVDHDGTVSTDSVALFAIGTIPEKELPGSYEAGIHYTSETSALLVLFLPDYQYSFVIGDFNDWQLGEDYLMNKVPGEDMFWVELTGLEKGKEYAFQYLVGDKEMTFPDWYAEKILDPWNDGSISNTVYPDLKEYPFEHATGIVSILQTAQEEFPWEEIAYERPEQTDLVIYELLVRDFLADHSYQSLIDTLPYLKRLGINAIELMPFNEFEGNESWGYNPSFYFAPDKYYGTKNKLKEFIQECHKNGMVVYMDMVLNHSFGQSPMVYLYFDGNQPKDNPWFNPVAKHDFNVGYDFNHESPETRKFSKRVMQFWMEEYRIDGYRFDLSKGFTQNNTLGDVGAWGQYDQSRIDIWNDYAAHMRSIDEDVAIILEHFATSSEEKELVSNGMMVWSNYNHTFRDAVVGNSSNFSTMFYQNRNMTEPGLITFMESHDEERLMYTALQEGRSNGDYNVKDLGTALKRVELSTVFFYSIPGPKMLWQFGELGYDVGINDPCRVCNKPIRWNYLNNWKRKGLYDVTAAMIHLKTRHEVFESSKFTYSLGGFNKSILLRGDSMDVMVIGNFDLKSSSSNYTFSEAGTWYDYFTGDSLVLTEEKVKIELAAGEYRLYTNKKLKQEFTSVEKPQVKLGEVSLFPNPVREGATVSIDASEAGTGVLNIYSATGALVWTQTIAENTSVLQVPIHFDKGIYLVQVESKSTRLVSRLLVTD